MKVGILGGGQLARMLILEAHRLGLESYVLCSDVTDPAAQVCPHVQIGSLNSAAELKEFFQKIDHVTVESEFLDTAVLEEAIGSLDFQPHIEILAKLQDRLSQKELLKEFSIPASPFVEWSEESVNDLHAEFKNGFVVKKRRFGYDGYGTFVFKKGQKGAVKKDPYGYIAEAFVPFRRELAFSIARNEDNGFAVFPLVETKQVNSRCFWVKGPIKHAGLSSLVNRFKKLMTAIDYRGILAMELFEANGKLTVNELAPRVHNSAHYSMDALDIGQFEAHWRGVLNWPLKNPEPLCKGFAMVNLLGENSNAELQFSLEPDGRLHWYGKSENRIGRKMGHLNTFGRSPDEALKKGLKWRKGFTI